MLRIVFLASVLTLVSGLVVGCGGERTSGASTNPQKDSLADLGQLLKQLSDEKKRPPGKLSELEPVEPMIPNASAGIRMGSIVYFWGAMYVAGGTKIVAHEKKAPEGGLVLLEDGTIKEMSAAEFAAAPKAKK